MTTDNVVFLRSWGKYSSRIRALEVNPLTHGEMDAMTRCLHSMCRHRLRVQIELAAVYMAIAIDVAAELENQAPTAVDWIASSEVACVVQRRALELRHQAWAKDGGSLPPGG